MRARAARAATYHRIVERLSGAFAVWLTAAGSSLFVVQKYGGWAGVSLYLVWSAAVVFAGPRVPLPRSALTRRLILLATFAALVVLFLVVYPMVNSHQPGTGSDDDDAYNLGARALLAGRSPYESTTYLGNVLHQFAGAFVLAVPFVVVLGTSAWQNLFWLAAFYVVARREADDWRAIRSLGLMLLAAPVVLHQVLTGTGHLANTLYVLVGMRFVMRTARPAIGGAMWGVALASRANFLFLVPLVFGWLWRERGPAAAVRAIASALVTVIVLVVPFYLHDPAHFGPLEAADRLQRINLWIPYGGEAVAGVMGLLAFALGCTRMDARRLLLNCAVVQAAPILVVLAVGFAATGYVDVAYAAYGTFVLPFVVTAWALDEQGG